MFQNMTHSLDGFWVVCRYCICLGSGLLLFRARAFFRACFRHISGCLANLVYVQDMNCPCCRHSQSPQLISQLTFTTNCFTTECLRFHHIHFHNSPSTRSRNISQQSFAQNTFLKDNAQNWSKLCVLQCTTCVRRWIGKVCRATASKGSRTILRNSRI